MMREGYADILVVDDEKTLRDIVSRALSKLGHRCIGAENGEAALALAHDTAFDLVVTDLKMPRMDGLTLVTKLRESQPDLPIIIMTGYADIESARKALRLRVSDYLVKPFESLAEVQAAAQRAVETRSSRRDADSLVKELEGKASTFEKREKVLTQSLEQAKIELAALALQLTQSKAVSSKQVGQVETIIANVGNGILVTDSSGRVMSLNMELRRQLQAASIPGTGISVDRLPGDAALRTALIESLDLPFLDGDEPVVCRTSDAAGRPVTYEVRSACVLEGDGGPVGIVTTVRETRQKPALVARRQA